MSVLIHDIGQELQAYLHANGCPLSVVDGPELATSTWGRERVVVEHDTEGKASFADPRGMHTNAKHRRTVTDPYKVTIYARSAKPGATPFEHRTRALNMRETVIAGMEYVARVRINRWDPTSGGFFTPPDLADTEKPGGAAYQILSTYQSPIRVVTFVGEAQPEGTVANFSSTTKVSRAGTPADDPTTPAETACGA